MNGKYTRAAFCIRNAVFPGDLYPGTVVRYHLPTEITFHKIQYNTELKNGRMRTLQERVEVPERVACDTQAPAEAQETQERTLDKHPAKQAKHELQEGHGTVFTANRG